MNLSFFATNTKAVFVGIVSMAISISAQAQYTMKCAQIVHGNGIPVLSSSGKVTELTYGTAYSDCCAADAKAQTKDTDGDGVYDQNDKCAATPSGVGVDALGCPVDNDSDGIADYLDACPSVAGVAAFKGCKDTDGDGIADPDDACPSVAGVANFKGCKDTDGDGIADPEDRCPEIAGVATLKGCKDTDNDGVADLDDKCPSVAGLVENKGCPKVDATTIKVLSTALTGLKFESGKAVILKSSYPILDKVVEVFKSHPEYKLDIAGHTDNSGDATKNLQLSKDRAKAAMDYLISKGIPAEEITSNGFGSEMPVADNSTPAGRAKNRRVEFKVGF
jgi:outer membrane protein OmpA-like peptidoglycan-associated protein